VCLARDEKCSQNGGSTCCDGLKCHKYPEVCTEEACPDEGPCDTCSPGAEICIPKDEDTSTEPKVCLARDEKCSQNGGSTCCDGLKCHKYPEVCTEEACPDEGPCDTCSPGPEICIPKDEDTSSEPKVCLAMGDDCSQKGGSTCCDGLECFEEPRMCTKRNCPDENPGCNHCWGGEQTCLPKDEETSAEYQEVCLAKDDKCSQNEGAPCCDGLECFKQPRMCTLKGCPDEKPDCNTCFGGEEICVPKLQNAYRTATAVDQEPKQCVAKSGKCSPSGGSTCCDGLECIKKLMYNGPCTKKACPDDNWNCNGCWREEEICVESVED